MPFLDELKRRRVLRAVSIYLAVAWLAFQVLDVVGPAVGAGDAVMRWLLIVAGVGLPVVFVLSWAVDVAPAATPDGDAGTREPWLTPRSVTIVAVLLAAGAAIGWLARPSPTGGAAGETGIALAVLPFSSLTGPDDVYLSDGLTEDIVVALQKAGPFAITGRASTERFRGSDAAPPQIAGELGVGYVLTGTVRSAGEQLRVSVQLADGETGRGLWADQYDYELTVDNLFDMYSDVAARVADALEARLAPDAASRLADPPTESLAAYELYMRGRSLWSQRLPELMPAAIDFFGRAIAEDSTYARAYSGLADAFILQAFYRPEVGREMLREAQEAARAAIELDPVLAEAHTSLAYTRWLRDWNWEGAEASFLRALELNPDYPTAHHWLGDMLGQWLRTDEAIARLDRALELDPWAVAAHFDRAKASLWAGRFEDAIPYFERAVEIDPDYLAVTYGLHTEALEGAGREDDAFEVYRRGLELTEGGEAAARMDSAYTAGGWDRVDEVGLSRFFMTEEARSEPFFVGAAHLAAGDREEALRWFTRAVDERAMFAPTLYSHPRIRGALREDPRYRELVRRLGLDVDWDSISPGR
ncbi:MAG: tetratricopeptide repeat protein [Gemmatimonadota bacterium]|nr:tetratricopeptide repeat protein [Gemmatimonadota bacterium]